MSRWIPWVLEDSGDTEKLEARLATYREHFREGGDALYAIMPPEEDRVLGGIGLYRRVGPRALEVGYWVRTDRAGRGIATAATAAVTESAFTLPGVERIEIHCDPANAASTAIPKKLGYRLRETLENVLVEQSGERADKAVWEITSEMLSLAYATA